MLVGTYISYLLAMYIIFLEPINIGYVLNKRCAAIMIKMDRL